MAWMRIPLTSVFVILALGLGVLPAGGRPAVAQVPPAARMDETSPGTSPADAWNVDYVGHIGGEAWAVDVQGDLAYIGDGPSLTVLDVSVPGSPTEVGRTEPLPDIVHGVAVIGGIAYVAAWDAGLRVVDVSDPEHPVEVGSYDTVDNATEVAAAGGYAYVADGEAGLLILRPWPGGLNERVWLPLILH